MQRLSAPERTREELRSLMNGAESIRWTATPDAAAALAEAESAAKALGAMQRGHRMAILASVGLGGVTAAEAFARVDAARRLDALAHHAWRSAAHLLGRHERETTP